MLDAADVLLWATETPTTAPRSRPSRSTARSRRCKDGKLVFTDGVTAGAIYFTSPLSLPFVLDSLVPALETAVRGRSGTGTARLSAPGSPDVTPSRRIDSNADLSCTR